MRMKKFSILVAALALFIALSACSKNTPAQVFFEGEINEGEVTVHAAEAIRNINERDTETLKSKCTAPMEAALTEEVLNALYTYTEEKGDFEKLEKTTVKGMKDEDTEEEFAVTTTVAKHGNGKIVYTITFDKDMKIAGLYYK